LGWKNQKIFNGNGNIKETSDNMKKFKFALIGYGNMGKDWGKVIRDFKNLELIAVVDVLEKNRIQACKDFELSESQTFDNLSVLLSKVKVDFILDCSPPFAHYKNTLAAFNYSTHVLGEKPISLNPEEAKDVVRLSQDKNLIYMVNQNYRRNPIIQLIKAKIKEIGKLYSVNIDYFQGLEFQDTFRYKFHHPLLLDMAIHHFDLVRMIVGQNAKLVYASEYNPVSSKFIDGSATIAQFKLEDSQFSYRGSWSSVGFNTSYNGQWRFIGENGTIIWDGDLSLLIERRNKEGNTDKEIVAIPQKFKLKPYDLFLYELKQNLKLFLESISTNTLPDCWCGDNINSLAMVLSAIKSSDKQSVVEIK